MFRKERCASVAVTGLSLPLSQSGRSGSTSKCEAVKEKCGHVGEDRSYACSYHSDIKLYKVTFTQEMNVKATVFMEPEKPILKTDLQ